MKIVEIETSDNVFYPLSQKFFEDYRIVYHGTSSVFSIGIESNGWKINEQPYDIIDFKKICQFLISLGYDKENSTSLSTLRTYTLGFDDIHIGKKVASFSQDFWVARNHARYPGGESFKAFFGTIDDLIEFLKNETIRNEHKKRLEKNGFSPYISTLPVGNIEETIQQIDDKKYLSEIYDELKLFKKKYDYIRQQHFPVVYAVKGKQSWFESWSNDY